jgi:hypothetical protein
MARLAGMHMGRRGRRKMGDLRRQRVSNRVVQVGIMVGTLVLVRSFLILFGLCICILIQFVVAFIR